MEDDAISKFSDSLGAHRARRLVDDAITQFSDSIQVARSAGLSDDAIANFSDSIAVAVVRHVRDQGVGVDQATVTRHEDLSAALPESWDIPDYGTLTIPADARHALVTIASTLLVLGVTEEATRLILVEVVALLLSRLVGDD